MSAVIGALRVVLGIDTAAFDQGLASAQKSLGSVGKKFESVGKALSVSVTAPLVAFGALTLKTAGGFEAAMNRVDAAAQAPAETVRQLGLLARDLGKLGPGATQAAEGIEGLIKNGLNAQQVLDGAGKATVTLAQAAGSELGPAADVVTDIMAQFAKRADEMGTVVDRVSGTLVASKLDFDGYKLAIGQAGGVAGKLGVAFDDFNGVLAATSPAFGSGSDAGTSFKTFLTRLIPASKKAGEMMKDLGLQFFDAAGKMKTMPEIAENLKTSLKGLSDEARNNALTEIFGTDALRTALLLSEQGADGINKVKAAIAGISATDQASAKLKGFNGAMKSMSAAIEDLQIAIADSGLLAFATEMVRGLTGLINELAASSPELLRWGVIVAGIAAVVGPIVLAIGLFASALAAIGLPAAAAIAGVAAVAVALFALKDKIAPALDAFGAKVTAILGPSLGPLLGAASAAFAALGAAIGNVFGGGATAQADGFLGLLTRILAQINSTFGEALIRVLTAAVQFMTGALTNMTSLLQAFTAFLDGDFAGAFGHLGDIVTTSLATLQQMFETLFPGLVETIKAFSTQAVAAFVEMKDGAVAAVGAMVEGIRVWLVDKLGGIFGSVKGYVQGFINLFKGAGDEIVHHSYVPDMVVAIGEWFAKLPGLMIGPTANATGQVSTAFANLGATIPAATAGVSASIAKVGTDATSAATKVKGSFSGVGDAFGKIGGAFKGATRGFFDDLRQGVKLTDALKNAVLNLLDKLSNMALDGVLDGLFGTGKAGGKGGGGGGGILGSLFSGLFGFASGGSFAVGGAGGVDSQVVAFRASPNEMVDVRKPGQMRQDGGGGSTEISVVPNKMFDVEVQRVARPMAVTAGTQAVRASDARVSTNQSRLQRHGQT